MLQRILLLVATLLMLAAGCTTGAAGIVRAQAATDLTCPEEYIKVRTGNKCNFHVRGCSKSATYHVKAKAEIATECCPDDECSAILKGNIESH